MITETLIRIKNNSMVCGYRDAHRAQGLIRGAMCHVSVRLITRAMTGTRKSIVFLFDGATQMCANQTQSGESILGLDQKRRNVLDKRAASDGIV